MVAMAASLVVQFIESPSWECLDQCLVADLKAIADHYGIAMPKKVLKPELKSIIGQALVEQGVLLSLPISLASPIELLSEQLPETLVVGDERKPEVLGTFTSPAKAVAGAGEAEIPPSLTLPRFNVDDPLSVSPPRLSGSDRTARWHLRVARLEAEKQERERERDRQAEYNSRIEIRRMELEAEIQLRRLEMEEKVALLQAKQAAAPLPQSLPLTETVRCDRFDVRKNIALVPPFREAEVESYFSVFERIAVSLHWPRDMWPLLLQCKLVGKAQEAVSTLSLSDSQDYDCVKSVVLNAFQLVPEAYRQKFRNHKKGVNKSYVEFAREKEIMFDRWCTACNSTDFDSLRELVMVEDGGTAFQRDW